MHDPGSARPCQMSEQAPSQPFLDPALDDDDRIRISEIFQQHIVPKLMMMHARNGTICCEFAGEEYKSWVIEFRSSRSGLDIVGFEYDPDSRSFELPHPHRGRDITSDV
jgi:hypothetical protein